MSAHKTKRTWFANQLVLSLLLLTASADAGGAELCLCDQSPRMSHATVAELDHENNDLINDCLVGDRFTECIGLRLFGWLQQGFTWNPDRPVDRFNGPVTQNDRANEYQLNQLYLTAVRAANTESDQLSFGFQGDMLYGTDAVFYQTLGLDDKIVSDRASRFYKLAFPQLYAEVYAPIGSGITFQIGKWFALVGYEAGLPLEDFFYSRTISFLGTPYSHTGILASFDLTDRLSVSLGLHRGSDVWEDNNNALSYTGSLTWTSCSEATVVSVAINLGPEQDERTDWHDIDGMPGPDAPGENLYRAVYSAFLEQQLTEKLQYVFAFDGYFQEGSAVDGIDPAEAYGITQYLIYQHCEQVASGLRVEVYRDDDGFVASGCRSENPSTAGVYTNLTLGLQLQALTNLQVRPEIRWDWQDRDDPTTAPAFNAGTSSDQFLFAVDLVAQF